MPELINDALHDNTAHKSTSYESAVHKSTSYESISHESAAHDSTSHDSISHESAAHESTAHDSISHESTAHDSASLYSLLQDMKTQLLSCLQSPRTSLDTIRSISEFLFHASPLYSSIIRNYANMGTCSYSVSCRSETLFTENSFLEQYQLFLEWLEHMHLRDEITVIITSALRDGAFFGFAYDDGSHFLIKALDPRYCRITSVRDGVYDFSFNASYFDQEGCQAYIDPTQNQDGLWDQVFIDGYQQYKSQGEDYQWFAIPSEKGVCILSGDDASCPLPYFTPMFYELLQCLKLRELLEEKALLDNSALLVSKIPMLSGTEDVNELACDMDLIKMCSAMIDKATPSLCSSVCSPCELQQISFHKEDNAHCRGGITPSLYEEYAELLFGLAAASGIAPAPAHRSGGSASVSLKAGEAVFYRLLSRIESWLNRYIALNISGKFQFRFHYTTRFSQKEWTAQLKDAAAFGLPVKMDYAISLGYTPLQILQQSHLEQTLDLNTSWPPHTT